jgi:hypothetical protein
MTVEDVKEIVEQAQIDPTYYSFDSERHESLCLLPFGKSWKVFLSERGQRYEERTFESEDEACTYFLKRLFQLAPRS